MAAAPARAQVHDFWPRILLSPVLGVGIAGLSGLTEHGKDPAAWLLASYAYFSVLAFLIWEGNRRLYFYFRDPDAWFTRAWQRIGVLIGCVFLYTVPISAVGILAWGFISGETVGARPVRSAVLLIVICTIFIVHVYETVFLLRDWESDRVRSEQLQRAAAEAELEALKREINPHVLFNSLHVLAQLIDTRNPRATEFVLALAEVYRYLLQTRRQPLVTLGEELTLLEQHAALADIRCAGALRVELDVDSEARSRLVLPPFSLPELLENALKHNRASPERPLHFLVRLKGDVLVVANDLRPADSSPAPSTRVGLRNLQHRFALTTGAAVTWNTTDDWFIVRLGLTRLSGETGTRSKGSGLAV